MEYDAHAELPYRRLETVPSGLRTAGIALTAIGAIALIAAFLTDPTRAWRAYFYNWLFFLSITQGAVLVSAVVSITKGLWSRPLRRFSLSYVAFLPIAYLLLIPILFIGADHIFPWIAEPVAGKDVWLNVPFLAIRTLLGLGILIAIDLVFAYHALRPDLGLIKDKVPAALRGLHDRYTRNWRGQEAEELHAYRKLQAWAPALAVVYALVMGMISWDFVMSLEPHWFSTLIGPYFFMGAFLGGLMLTAITALRYRKGLALEAWIPTKSMHDLGKLCFGFTIFWGYLFFGQYIVIWYGLLPMEQSFVIHRFTAPYVYASQLVGLCIFVLPFFGLMGVTTKVRPELFTLFASISLFGLYAERYVLTYPSFYTGADNLPLSWPEPGIALFFAGLVILSHLWFASRFPIIQMWQPAGEVELAGIPMERQETANVR